MSNVGTVVYFFTFLQIYTHVSSEIRHSIIVNKLTKGKPPAPGPLKPFHVVGSPTRQPKTKTPSHAGKAHHAKPPSKLAKPPSKLAKVRAVGDHWVFVPLTEIPPPKNRLAELQHLREDKKSGRRHMEDCSPRPDWHEVEGGPVVHIAGEFYDEHYAATARTVRIPEHIDHMHFDVTTPVAYLTLGHTIEAIGYHPTTETPNSCEKIYQEHLFDQYSEESADVSEESLEVARMPLFPPGNEGQQTSYEIYADAF